jgi:HAD superfamily hydrolase (TIGR01509 family)
MIEESIKKYLMKNGFEAIRLKAVLFDMDGVLFDSMKNHAYAWSHAATEFGLFMTPEEAYLHEGRTGAGTINILANRHWKRDATQEEIDSIYKRKTEFFQSCPTAESMPGAWEVLCKVKEDGLTRMVVTGSGQHSLLDRLNHNFPEMFQKELMVTSFDVKFGKPSPEPYLMALHKGNFRPNQAVVVENAPLGVRSAVAAGIFTIAVNTGPIPDEALSNEGANIVLSSMQELADRWEEIHSALNSVSVIQ